MWGAHRPLPGEVDLEAVFAETEGRGGKRLTGRFRSTGRCRGRGPSGVRPGTKVVVKRRLGDDVRLRTGERNLAVERLSRERPRVRTAATNPRPARAAGFGKRPPIGGRGPRHLASGPGPVPARRGGQPEGRVGVDPDLAGVGGLGPAVVATTRAFPDRAS